VHHNSTHSKWIFYRASRDLFISYMVGHWEQEEEGNSN